VFAKKSNGAIAAGLVTAVFLWGATNAGTKYVLQTWPPITVGLIRFFCAGVIMLAILKWTRVLGPLQPVSRELRRRLWVRGGLSLAMYILAFNLSLQLTNASHTALYLGAAPVWALLWEERPARNWRSAKRYGSALLAASGVIVLFLPTLKTGGVRFLGEFSGLSASFLWANYGHQSRVLAASLSGAEVAAHTMWRAGVWLMPLAVIEIIHFGMPWNPTAALIQLYCVVGGGVVAYALWNNGLKHWSTSQVFLFNNLVPITTMTWAWFCLGEPFTHTFWIAMILIVAGVVLGRTSWENVFGADWSPE